MPYTLKQQKRPMPGSRDERIRTPMKKVPYQSRIALMRELDAQDATLRPESTPRDGMPNEHQIIRDALPREQISAIGAISAADVEVVEVPTSLAPESA